MKIEKGRKVKLKVDLAVAGGDTLEKSTVEFTQGGGSMLIGIEKLLEGLEKGAKRDGVLKAKEAFGNPAMHPVKQMNRSEFPKDQAIKVGERFAASGANGMNVYLQIEKVDTDMVTVRFVHPLAEKDIKYSVEVIQVSDPRPPPMPAAAFKLEESE